MNAAELGVLIPIIAIISIFALPIITALILIFKKISSTHKERMGLIEQGIIPPEESNKKRERTPNRYVSLRNGIVLIFLGVGLIVGFLITSNLSIGNTSPFFFIVATTVLFLGIGYALFYKLTKDAKGYRDSDLEDDAE